MRAAGSDRVITDPRLRPSDVSRIGAPDAPLLARPYFDAGDPGPIVAVLAHVPELLEVALPFIGLVLGASAIPARVKELVVVRTSAGAGCQFCVDAHSVVALDTGLTITEVRALRGELPLASAFPDVRERALLGWVDLVSLRGAIRPADRTTMLAHFEDHQVVELTMVTAATLMLNRFCTALNVPTSPAVAARLAECGLS